MSRYPFTPFPNSWFQVAWSDDLPRGAVKPLHFFGKDLVMFRTKDGEAHVLDAHCPHLGTHLGFGGRVEGNTIRCPAHGWQIDGAGRCAHIPYASKIPPKAEINSWPVREVNGFIFIYHHAQGKAPDFEIPVLPEYASGEWTGYYKHTCKLPVHAQDIMENGPDMQHLRFLHGFPLPPQLELNIKGHVWHMDINAPKAILGRTFGNHLDVSFHGLGLIVTRNTATLNGKSLDCIIQIGSTPIDEKYTQVTQTVMFLKRGSNPILRRLSVWGIRQTAREDYPVWANKIYRERPVLCDNDGPIMDFRKWCKQFYSPMLRTAPVLHES